MFPNRPILRRTITVLTVQFDVTHLTLEAINELAYRVSVQGEEFPCRRDSDDTASAELLNIVTRDVETEDY